MSGSNAQETSAPPSRKAPREQLEAQLLATARVVRRAYDDRLAELDLNMTEASLLRFVQLQHSLSQRELADRLHIGRAATGSFIESLRARGLVSRDRDPNDARVWRITLTDAGVELAEAFDAANHEILRSLRSGLNRTEQRHLGDLLAKVRANAERMSAADGLAAPAADRARPRRANTTRR